MLPTERRVRELLREGASRREVYAACGRLGIVYFDELVETPGALEVVGERRPGGLTAYRLRSYKSDPALIEKRAREKAQSDDLRRRLEEAESERRRLASERQLREAEQRALFEGVMSLPADLARLIVAERRAALEEARAFQLAERALSHEPLT